MAERTPHTILVDFKATIESEIVRTAVSLAGERDSETVQGLRSILERLRHQHELIEFALRFAKPDGES